MIEIIGKVVIIQTGKYKGQKGLVKSRNDIKTFEQFTGQVKRIIEAYDIYLFDIKEAVRYEPFMFLITDDKPPISESSIEFALSVLWGAKRWNGKIYGGNSIYINNTKITLTLEQIKILKDKPTPQSLGATLVSKVEDLSANWGVRDSTFCQVKTWELNGVQFKTVSHDY